MQFILVFIFLMSGFMFAHAAPVIETRGWTRWSTLGGTITSDPAACTAGYVTFVFARGTDNMIWFRQRYLPTGRWTEWKKIPDIFSPPSFIAFQGAPAARCGIFANKVTVFVSAVGFDNHLWSVRGWGTGTTDGFEKWYQTPGFSTALNSGPALAGWDYGPWYQFVRGGDDRIYMKAFADGIDKPFQVLVPESVHDDPAAVMSSLERLEFFYRDHVGRLWQQTKIGAIWHPRQLISGEITSAPDVVSRDPSSLDLFAKGNNNTIIYKSSVNGVWGPWIDLGGYVVSGPGVTTYANKTRIFVFARWTTGELYYRAWAP